MTCRWTLVVDRTTGEKRWAVRGPISEVWPGRTVVVKSSKGSREIEVGAMTKAHRLAGDEETIVTAFPN